ncbi:unnamed protein product [Lepidochelys kempii]
MDPTEDPSLPWDMDSTSSSTLGSRAWGARAGPVGASSLHCSLEELLACRELGGSREAKPRGSRPCRCPPPAPVGPEGSEGDTSDSGAESPVCMEPPWAPVLCQHVAGPATAQLWWVTRRGSDWVSLYELRLQEPSGTRSQWFCAQAPERLQNLSPGTQYRIRVRALNAAGPGPWSPPYIFATVPRAKEAIPVMVTVRRRLDFHRKTIYLPGP